MGTFNFMFKEIIYKRTYNYSSGELFIHEYYVVKKLTQLIHNPNGPASTMYYCNGSIKFQSYCNYNKLHRTDGPARIWFNKDGSVFKKDYWVNGFKIEVNSDENFIASLILY